MSEKPATILAIGIVLAIAINPANATFVDGNKLFKICVVDPIVTGCIGYITGVVDRATEGFPSCPPDGTTIRQITESVAVVYLKEHPIERSMPAAMLVQRAIIGAWHCNVP